MVKELLNKKARVNVVNKNGETPLYQAILNADYEIVKLLVDRGADVNVEVNGHSLLYYAKLKRVFDKNKTRVNERHQRHHVQIY